jgi:hypothetical protein
VTERLTERHVLALGLAVSGAFVVAAAATAVMGVLQQTGVWAALHLALAGAATVAIGTFMPHFAVTLAGTRPAPSVQRLTSLVLLAAGAVLAVLGITVLDGRWAAAGSAVMVAGLGVVAWHTYSPSRDPLARRHTVVALAYGLALVQLAAGVILGGLGALGIDAIVAEWALLRGAHAWLTLFGAVSVTIFATLVYLAPTVLGARIKAGMALIVGVAGMLAGPLVATAGFALDSVPAAVAGMGITVAGAVGQLAYVIDAYRRRGPFTSEHDWRRVAIGHFLAGPAWFLAAVAVATAEVLLGRPLAGWSIGVLAVPMVAGWMLQELVGSWTHLVPSVTVGDAASHARQRRVLAAASRTRLIAWNAGVALAWIGISNGGPLAAAGLALTGASVVASLILLGRALTIGRS